MTDQTPSTYPTIRAAAAAFAGAFETRTRVGENFVCLADTRPEWMRDAVHEAHGDELPDDWRYGTCKAAADFIEEQYDRDDLDDLRDLAAEFADGATDHSYHALALWLAHAAGAWEMADDVKEQGLAGADVALSGWLRSAQAQLAELVYFAILEACAEQVEEGADNA